ncbi:MAG: hypothetical protein JOZ69_03735 [Myxococcales bacterium]|nr:hypothetical protein [Myxococcales bacterium]
MKSPLAVALWTALAAVASSTAGCAEEEMETRPIAYPVGVSTAGASAAQPPPGAAAVPPPPRYVRSAEIVIGADGDGEGEAAEAAETEGAEGQAGSAPEPGTPDAPPVSDTDPSAMTDFHATLDPYGSWVDDETYGSVWVPSPGAVGEEFTPYVSGGHWAYDDEYVWVSDYPWGWAPFHYGRWVHGPRLGWAWIPGRAYAGAWVSWRYGWDDWAYVGWAPLAPAWCWRHGAAVGLGFAPSYPYAFVATGDLFAPGIGGHVVTGTRAGFISAHTRPWIAPAAQPTGRVVARPVVGGPPPSALRIPDGAVAHAGSDASVLRARAFARPIPVVARAASFGAAGAGAIPVGRANGGPQVGGAYAPAGGAYAPAGGAPRAMAAAGTPPTPPGRAIAAAVAPAEPAPRPVAPAYGPPAPSHFGGRFGAGFAAGPSMAGPMRTVPPGPSYAPSSSPAAPRPYFGAPLRPTPAPQPVAGPAPFPHGISGPSPISAPARVAAPVASPAVRPFGGGGPSAVGAAVGGGVRGGGGYSGGAAVRAVPRAGGRR